MEPKPDFFLSTAGESDDIVSPRACWQRVQLTNMAGEQLTLVDIDPSVVVRQPEHADLDLSSLVIVPKKAGASLSPVSEWPLWVIVARILDSTIRETHFVAPGQVEAIAWAAIYRTLEEANAVAARFH